MKQFKRDLDSVLKSLNTLTEKVKKLKQVETQVRDAFKELEDKSDEA